MTYMTKDECAERDGMREDKEWERDIYIIHTSDVFPIIER